VKTEWKNGIEADAVDELRGLFKSSLIIRKRLVEILEGKIETVRTDARKKVNYDKAHWPAYVADALGYERALEEVISLLTDPE